MIGNRFSAAAKTYDRHARPQLELASAVLSAIPQTSPSHILELGPGTGQLTRLLARRFPTTPIDAVDVAEKMIEHSRLQFQQHPQINWMVGDAQTYTPNKSYSIIASSSALHWVTDLAETFRNIYQYLEPNGVFALGMMLEGTLKELHQLRRAIAPEKTPESTLPSYQKTISALAEAGFEVEQTDRKESTTIYSTAKDLLKALHEQGVTSGKVSAAHTPLNRKELNELIAKYQALHSTPTGVKATYETTAILLRKA